MGALMFNCSVNGLYQILAPRAASRLASKGKGWRPDTQIERSGPVGVGYSATVTAKLALPGTGRNQGSVGDRGVPATACCGCDLHGLGEGSGERVPLFSSWRFPYPGQGLVGIAHRLPHRFWG